MSFAYVELDCDDPCAVAMHVFKLFLVTNVICHPEVLKIIARGSHSGFCKKFL